MVAPLVLPATYGDKVYSSSWLQACFYGENFYTDKNDVLYFKSPIPGQNGCFQFYQHQGEYIFKPRNGKWELDYDVFGKCKTNGFDLNKTNKIVHFHTLADPTQGNRCQNKQETKHSRLKSISKL